MYRTGLALTLALLVGAAAGLGRAGDPPGLKDALALEEAFQAAIQEAEPSIACVLVSRSDAYRKYFGDAPPADKPGKLGPFDPKAPPRPGFGEKGLPQEELRRFNLADPANVPEAYGSGVV